MKIIWREFLTDKTVASENQLTLFYKKCVFYLFCLLFIYLQHQCITMPHCLMTLFVLDGEGKDDVVGDFQLVEVVADSPSYLPTKS